MPVVRKEFITPSNATDTGYENNPLITTAASGVFSGGKPEAVHSWTPSAPAHGTLTNVAADGSFTYTPISGYTGSDSFSYFTTTAIGTQSSSATVTINVTPLTLTATSQDTGNSVVSKDATPNPILNVYSSDSVTLASSDAQTSPTYSISGAGGSSGTATLSNGQVTFSPDASGNFTITGTLVGTSQRSVTLALTPVTLNSTTATDNNGSAGNSVTVLAGSTGSLTFTPDNSGNASIHLTALTSPNTSAAQNDVGYTLEDDTGATIKSGKVGSGTDVTIPQPASGHADRFTLVDGILSSAGTFIGNTATVQLASIMPTVTISGTSTKDASGKTVPDPRVNPTTNTITVLQDVTKQTQVTVNVSVTNAEVGLPDYYFSENIGTTPTPPSGTRLVTPDVTDIMAVQGGAAGSYSTTISVPPNATPGTYTWDFIDALHGNLKVTLTIVIVGPNA